MTSRLSGMAAGPSVLCALSCASLLVCGAGRAAAHDPPTGTGVYTRGDQLVVRTQRGLLVSSSAERRELRFLCNEALGVAEFAAPSVLLQADQSMLVGTSAGLVRVSADLCTIDALPALGAAQVNALVRETNESQDVYAATDAGFFVSHDDGQSFGAQDSNVFDSLQLARDRAVYASGRYPGPRGQPRVFFARWQAGAKLEQHELVLEPTEVGVAVLGSDPRREQRVFAVAHAYLGTQYLDRFLVSDDAAQSWSVALAAASIGAFAIDPATDTWLVGAATGLWRARSGEEPVRVRDDAVSCLSLAQEQLYVCDGSGAAGGLSLSADGGETWRSLFRFDQVAGLSRCPAESRAVQQCQTAWADWTLEMPPGAPLPGVDAGGTEPAPEADGGDAGTRDALASSAELAGTRDTCAAVSGKSTATQSAWRWLLPAAALLVRRRRRDRSPSESKQT